MKSREEMKDILNHLNHLNRRNIISFTPLHGQQNITQKKGDEQKKQRSPRRRSSRKKSGSLTRQSEQNREISHISPGGQVNVFNTEEFLICSYHKNNPRK